MSGSCVPRLPKPRCQALPCATVFGKPVPKYECGKYVCDPLDFLVQQMALQTLDASGNTVDIPQCSRASSGGSIVSSSALGSCCNGGQYLPVIVPGFISSGISGSNTFMQCNTQICSNLPSTYGTCLGDQYATSTVATFVPILNGPGSRYM